MVAFTLVWSLFVSNVAQMVELRVAPLSRRVGQPAEMLCLLECRLPRSVIRASEHCNILYADGAVWVGIRSIVLLAYYSFGSRRRQVTVAQ